LKALQRHSPTGLKVALEAINRAKDLNFAEVLVQDLRTTMHAVEGDDLAEGIRAQIIDKDRNPQWNPAHLSDVTDTAVAAIFEPFEGGEDLALNYVRTYYEKRIRRSWEYGFTYGQKLCRS